MRMHGLECLLSETGQHAVQWRAERCKALGLCGIGLINFCESPPPATLEGAKILAFLTRCLFTRANYENKS